jgi:hypothetical protein
LQRYSRHWESPDQWFQGLFDPFSLSGRKGLTVGYQPNLLRIKKGARLVYQKNHPPFKTVDNLVITVDKSAKLWKTYHIMWD